MVFKQCGRLGRYVQVVIVFVVLSMESEPAVCYTDILPLSYVSSQGACILKSSPNPRDLSTTVAEEEDNFIYRVSLKRECDVHHR